MDGSMWFKCESFGFRRFKGKSHLCFFCLVRQRDVFHVNHLVLGEFNTKCLSSNWYLWLFTESLMSWKISLISIWEWFCSDSSLHIKVSTCFQPLNQHLNLWMRNVKVYIDITDFNVWSWDIEIPPESHREGDKSNLLLSVESHGYVDRRNN